MAKNFKLIKGIETSPLKMLNEGQALKNPDKYVFQGIFTQCSTPEHKVVNRNGRIYMEKEVLRHLGYLRDQIKENNGRLLGELDHPEGRFDVQMKEASHAITDLWYDDKTKCVMGRLEVLDTPNGKTLKSIIDAGYPLYVSSRAAGDIDERTKEVEIAQIFTYDVVCTPGFKEAKLERVNESLNLSDKALKYINESISKAEDAKEHDIVIPVSAISESAINYKAPSLKSLCEPLLESDETENQVEKKIKVVKKTKVAECDNEVSTDNSDFRSNPEKDALNDVQQYYKVMETTPEIVNEEDGDAEEPTEISDEKKEENRKLILDIKGVEDDSEKEDSESEEKNDKSDDIISIKATEKSEEKTEEDDETKEPTEEKTEKKESDEDSEESTDESCEALKNADKKDKIKKETDNDIEELNSILASVEKSEAVKESIIKRYPFAISLSESNFAKFASLRPKLKKRCADFIEENEVYDIRMINELWTTPLREDKKLQENWLKLASQSDIDLFVAAPIEVQNAIEESAKFWVLETQEEVDAFWESTGLRQSAYKRAMNEKFVKDYQKTISESQENERFKLGYDMNIIKTMEQWYNN